MDLSAAPGDQATGTADLEGDGEPVVGGIV